MKTTKSKIKFTVLIFSVFIFGAFIGLMMSSYLYYQHVFSQMADETAGVISYRIDTLCQLRLGEIESAIKQLEESVDVSVNSITQTPFISQTNVRYKVLRLVKTYRELYPTESPTGSALRDIPKFETFGCESSLSRLVAQKQKTTNSSEKPLSTGQSR